MNLKQQNPALLLIDIQKGFEAIAYWGGKRNNPDAEKKSATLLNKWRELQLPIFHIQHGSQNPKSPLHPSKPGFALQDIVNPMPNEPVYVKDVNSAFIGTPLETVLKSEDISKVVIVGMTTNHCISTSVRMAGNLGFDTFLVSDATATFDRKGINGELFDAELLHQTTLASLQDEFATVINTDELLESL